MANAEFDRLKARALKVMDEYIDFKSRRLENVRVDETLSPEDKDKGCRVEKLELAGAILLKGFFKKHFTESAG